MWVVADTTPHAKNRPGHAGGKRKMLRVIHTKAVRAPEISLNWRFPDALKRFRRSRLGIAGGSRNPVWMNG
jgi:hypothetical protein